MKPELPVPPSQEAVVIPATPLTNSERLRAILSPDSLAAALMAGWKKGDPDSQARMLAALHDFHKPK